MYAIYLHNIVHKNDQAPRNIISSKKKKYEHRPRSCGTHKTAARKTRVKRCVYLLPVIRIISYNIHLYAECIRLVQYYRSVRNENVYCMIYEYRGRD